MWEYLYKNWQEIGMQLKEDYNRQGQMYESFGEDIGYGFIYLLGRDEPEEENLGKAFSEA